MVSLLAWFSSIITLLGNIGGRPTIKKQEPKKDDQKSREEKLAERKAKRDLQIKQSKENKQLVDLEENIKKLKDDIVYRIQWLIEYKQDTILPEDWPKIYILLDETLLDEIFQERDAISVCCNLSCVRKLTKVHPNIGNLINFQSSNIEKDDLLNGKVNEIKQNYFYCSPKCRSESNEIIAKIKEDLESYIFKDCSYFSFCLNYKNCADKYNELVESLHKFKEICHDLKIDRSKAKQNCIASWMQP